MTNPELQNAFARANFGGFHRVHLCLSGCLASLLALAVTIAPCWEGGSAFSFRQHLRKIHGAIEE